MGRSFFLFVHKLLVVKSNKRSYTKHKNGGNECAYKFNEMYGT